MDYFWVAIGIMVAILAVQLVVSGRIDQRAAKRRAEAQLPPPENPYAPIWPDDYLIEYVEEDRARTISA